MNVKSFSELILEPLEEEEREFVGEKIRMYNILDKKVIINHYKITDGKYDGKCLTLQILYEERERVVFTSGKNLQRDLRRMGEDSFPFEVKIIKNDTGYHFRACE